MRLADPTTAEIVATPVPSPDGGYTTTSGCRDITAYPQIDLGGGRVHG